ncbi:hypothetical protein C8R46DRAFT_1027479 [Mycena filopes]|nr:hypothetical protein C8R46DRAFT_1027479 [Mycena filopes]
MATGLPRFADEIILEIFEHLTDQDLLSLAIISQHIHEVALLAYFSRYGITESDIATKTFPQLSNTGAFRAFCVARFIAGVDTLRLRFDQTPTLHRDVDALARFARRMPPIKSVDLEFSPWQGGKPQAQLDVVGLLLTVISDFRTRPIVVMSPFAVCVVRPHKPSLRGIRGILERLRPTRSSTGPESEPITIDEKQFRDAVLIFTLMRAGRVIPSVSIRMFDPPAPLGAVLVVHAAGLRNLHFAADLHLSPAEMSLAMNHITVPLLRSINAEQHDIPEAALHGLICRHPTLEHLKLRGSPATPPASAAPPPPLPADALPQIEHIIGSARLLAWLLASPHPFPLLRAITLEMRPGPHVLEDYRTALRGLARRFHTDTVALKCVGCAPWDAPDFAAAEVPEHTLTGVVDLRLTFLRPTRAPRDARRFIAWLRLFGGLRRVALFDTTLPLGGYCGVLQKELPHITFTSHILPVRLQKRT